MACEHVPSLRVIYLPDRALQNDAVADDDDD